MPKKQEWTVRVVNFGDEGDRSPHRTYLNGLWVEQLRYLGMARQLGQFSSPERTVIEFYCQNTKIDSKVWAEQNAARMRSFGIDAAAAPKWENDRYEGPHTETPQGERIHMERFNG